MTGVRMSDQARRSGYLYQGKRIFDIFTSAVCLILLAPVMLVIGALIWIKNGRPIIFRQERIGFNRRISISLIQYDFDRRRKIGYGQIFILYKFRTMCVNAGDEQVLSQKDARITSFGKFLRVTRLDELPQLFNVLCGNMSMVGPRPHYAKLVHYFVRLLPDYNERLEIKPGLTGLSRVSGIIADNSLQNMVDSLGFEFKYVQKANIWLDVNILFRTILVVIRKKGL